jgi:methylmalonyl-CoA mutase N-terminal domain/subunit
MEETGVANTVDPLGGSYFLEATTNRLESQAREYFQQIEDLGGVLPAIQTGFMQREIQNAAYRYQLEIDQDDRIIVGINAFADDGPVSIPLLEMDPQGYEHQVSRLEDLRQSRDNGAVGQALDRLRIACEGTENTMPFILDAVRVYATLGEVTDVMREVFGTYEEPSWL